MNRNDSDAHSRWAAWLDEYGWRLLVHARQLLPQRSDAEDLVQEVVLELWRGRASDLPPDLPLALFKLRQRAIDHGRSHSSRLQRETHWQEEAIALAPGEPDPEEAIPMQVVQQALDRLAAPFREVVSLKLWGGLTFDEIAAMLKISRNTAASRYRLALGKLKPLLKSSLP